MLPTMFFGGMKLAIFQDVEKEFSSFITHWFQPIYELGNNNILGYEALLRNASQLKVSPTDIFKEAEKKGCENILDLLSIKTAIESFECESKLLFLNIFPSTLLQKNFLSWWDINVPSSMTAVLELLESESIRNWKALRKITSELQTRGVKIAVDDMGRGYSFYQQWIELDPDFIKLDRYFAENISENSRKQKAEMSLV